MVVLNPHFSLTIDFPLAIGLTIPVARIPRESLDSAGAEDNERRLLT